MCSTLGSDDPARADQLLLLHLGPASRTFGQGNIQLGAFILAGGVHLFPPLSVQPVHYDSGFRSPWHAALWFTPGHANLE